MRKIHIYLKKWIKRPSNWQKPSPIRSLLGWIPSKSLVSKSKRTKRRTMKKLSNSSPPSSPTPANNSQKSTWTLTDWEEGTCGRTPMNPQRKRNLLKKNKKKMSKWYIASAVGLWSRRTTFPFAPRWKKSTIWEYPPSSTLRQQKIWEFYF